MVPKVFKITQAAADKPFVINFDKPDNMIVEMGYSTYFFNRIESSTDNKEVLGKILNKSYSVDCPWYKSGPFIIAMVVIAALIVGIAVYCVVAGNGKDM